MKPKYILYVFIFLIIGITNYCCKKDALTAPTVVTPVDPLAWTQLEKDSILKGDTNDLMRILTIFNVPDSLVLRKESMEVHADSTDTVLIRLIRRMYYTLQAETGGVGIAAPQVGINRDIIWVQRFDKAGYPFEYYLNAKIVLYSNKSVLFQNDGCLSIPGQSAHTHRYSSVVVEYDLLDGSHHEELVEGWGGSNITAVIFQHEIDHLNGILYIDRIDAKKEQIKVGEINAIDLFTK